MPHNVAPHSIEDCDDILSDLKWIANIFAVKSNQLS
jgi:hypothetical protein